MANTLTSARATSVLTHLIKEMVKRDLEIERRRAVADSRNNPY